MALYTVEEEFESEPERDRMRPLKSVPRSVCGGGGRRKSCVEKGGRRGWGAGGRNKTNEFVVVLAVEAEGYTVLLRTSTTRLGNVIAAAGRVCERGQMRGVGEGGRSFNMGKSR